MSRPERSSGRRLGLLPPEVQWSVWTLGGFQGVLIALWWSETAVCDGPRVTSEYGALVQWKTEVLAEVSLGPPQIPHRLPCWACYW